MSSVVEPLVVIGVGNLTRGDDAIGRLAARALAARRLPEICIIETAGEATLLLDAFTGATSAIVIDACKSGAPVGTIHRFDATQAPIPADVGSVSSHGFGLAAALELARTFEQLPRRCIVFAMDVENFTHGAPLTTQVAMRFDELVASIEREIEQMRAAQDS